MGFAAIAQSARYATRHDLERFDSSQTLGRWSWPKDTTKLEGRWIQFFCLLIRYGFTGIQACEGAITDAEWRTQHQTRSSRTTFRVLAALEKLGYIRRYRLRLGKANKTIWIEFLPKLGDLLSFSRVEKKEKIDHDVGNILHLPNWQTMDRTISDPSVPTPDISCFKSNATRAREHKKWKWEPIAFTARCLTSGVERSELSRRINEELRGEHNRSAIDWAYWVPRWPDMTILERENTFLCELMPALTEKKRADQVAERGKLEKNRDQQAAELGNAEKSSNGAVYDLGKLEKGELEALFWAKQAAQADQRGGFD